MNLIDVIPLARLPRAIPPTLTYYTSKDLSPGACVLISIQNRRVVGVVTKSAPLSGVKALIRKQDFLLKRIESVIADHLIPASSLKLFIWTARFFVSPLPLVFKTALPNFFAKPTRALAPFLQSITPLPQSDQPRPSPQTICVIGPAPDRRNRYLCAIEDVLTADPSGQILILFPTSSDAGAFFDLLPDSLRPVSRLFTSRLADRTQATIWKEAVTGAIRIVIGTRNAVFTPLPRLALCIVDREHSAYFKAWDGHPRIDARDIAEKWSNMSGAALMLGGIIPREETWYRIQEGDMQKETVGKEPRPSLRIIDTRKVSVPNADVKEPFHALTSALNDAIRQTCARGEQVFLFLGRRGYSAHIVCRDCGHRMLCPHCNAPLVIHAEKDRLAARVLICHKCLKRDVPPAVCPSCGGHSIHAYGIGTQKVEEELAESFLDIPAVRIDSDASEDPEGIEDLLRAVRNGAYRIVVGTEIALKPSLLPLFGLSAVVSFGQLLSQPDFRQEERVFGMIRTLEEMTRGDVCIQTSTPAHPLIRDIESDDADLFFKRDIVFRKSFLYPPFAEVIQLTVAHPLRLAAEKNALMAKTALEEGLTLSRVSRESIFIIGPLPAAVPKQKGAYVYHIILKVRDQHAAVKEVLASSLPPYAMIDVNPKMIL